MKTIATPTGIVGVYQNVTVSAEALLADDSLLPLSALGDYTVVDGAPPSLAHTWDGTQWVAPAAPPLDRASLVAKIDATVRDIYEKSAPSVISDIYKERETAAQAFKDGGYVGTVPSRVAEFSVPAGMTATAAADLILSQAQQLVSARDALESLRMKKYLVQLAVDDATAQTQFDSIMAQIKTIGASLT